MLRPSRRGAGHHLPPPAGRDVAYASLPKVDRAHRHARAARWAAERGARVGSTQVDPFVGAQAEALSSPKSMGLPADDPVREVRFVGYAALVRLGGLARQRDEYLNSAGICWPGAVRLGEEDQPKELVISRP